MRGHAERTQRETVTVIAAGELEVVILHRAKKCYSGSAMYVSLLINATTVGTISVQRLGLGLGKYEAAFREDEIDEAEFGSAGNGRSRSSH